VGFTGSPCALHALVRVAGSRWSIEELFQTGKGQVGPRPHRDATATAQPNPDQEIIASTIAEIRRPPSPLPAQTGEVTVEY
jgi:hypothetical protein